MAIIGYNRGYTEYNQVRSVTLTVPGPGITLAHASGTVDWESEGWDVLIIRISVNTESIGSSWYYP